MTTRYRQPPSGKFVQDAVSSEALEIGGGTPNRVARFQGTLGVTTSVPPTDTPTAIAGLSNCQISPGLPEGYHYDFRAGLWAKALAFTGSPSFVIYLEYSVDAGVTWLQAQRHSLFQWVPVGRYIEVGNVNLDRTNPVVPGIITKVRLMCVAPSGPGLTYEVDAALSWIRVEQYIT